MKTRLSLMITVAALFLLSALFSYGRQTGSSMVKPTAFVPGFMQMGAEIPPPTVLTLNYGSTRVRRTFPVNEPLNISIQNSSDRSIWYVRRRPPGVDSVLLQTESISVERMVNHNWKPSGQYPTVIDDPDGQFAPQRKRIGAGVTILRRWTPREPGQYRVSFIYYTESDPEYDDNPSRTYSEPFTVK